MDVPAAGWMAETPPWLLAFRTPSPTIGHRKAPSVPVWSADATPALARLVIALRAAATASKRARCGSKRRLFSERSIGRHLAYGRIGPKHDPPRQPQILRSLRRRAG